MTVTRLLVALAILLQGSSKLVDREVGYSLSYPAGWKVRGQIQATAFAEGAQCRSVEVIDYEPPPGATSDAKRLHSSVQVCARPVDGGGLHAFMSETYAHDLARLFEATEMAGVAAYRTRGKTGQQTIFLQTDEHRIQIVSAVVSEPRERAMRLAQVNEVIASFSIEIEEVEPEEKGAP